MDEQTNDAINSLVRMIDSINSTNGLASLSFNLTVISVCSQRLSGAMPKPMETLVEAAFAECDELTKQQPYENARTLFLKARDTWEASAPRDDEVA